MGEQWRVGDMRRARQVDVGLLFGVTGKTVREWGVEGGCPRNLDGSYDLREVVKWYVARERGSGGLPELTEEERQDPVLVAALMADSSSRERLLHWKAEKARIDYEQACERLVPREQVRELLSVLAVRLREAGEMLQRNFGGAAGKVLVDVLDAREWGRYGVADKREEEKGEEGEKTLPQRGGGAQRGRRGKR